MKGKLPEVAGLFFKLGCIAFGGPAAHIAMMEQEVVSKRKWMTREHFLDLVGATNLIPGPNSTEMTMHCGHERAGIPGLLVAGLCFILPSVAITGLFGWAYAEYGQLPAVEPFIYGIKPAVLSIIAAAIFKLGKKAAKGTELIILGILTLVAALAGLNEILALFAAGGIGTLYFHLKGKLGSGLHSLLPLGMLFSTAFGSGGTSSGHIFLSFLKIGATLFGSGYVLFAYLDAEFVLNGMLSRQQLMDAVAVGQFTPGPILSTATFIGFQLDGISGALAATAGIFLPSFLLVWVLNPLVPRMRRSTLLGYFLDSVNIAAVAVMAAVLLNMGAEALVDWKTLAIAAAGMAVTFAWKNVNAVWIVIGGALGGYLLALL